MYKYICQNKEEWIESENENYENELYKALTLFFDFFDMNPNFYIRGFSTWKLIQEVIDRECTFADNAKYKPLFHLIKNVEDFRKRI